MSGFQVLLLPELALADQQQPQTPKAHPAKHNREKQEEERLARVSLKGSLEGLPAGKGAETGKGKQKERPHSPTPMWYWRRC